MAEPPLSSNNPFRRKPAAFSSSSQPSQITTAAAADFDGSGASGLFTDASFFSPAPSSVQTHPTGDEFRQQLQSFVPSSSSAEARPPSTSFAISKARTKPVKKVRVQSPPPSPPSSPSVSSSPSSVDEDFGARFPAAGVIAQPTPSRPVSVTLEHGDYSDFYDDITATTRITDTTRPIQTIQHPHNPFQRTLGDLEPGTNDGAGQAPGGGAAVAAAGGPKPLDVDAFSRLLLTGQGPVPAAAPAAPVSPAPPAPAGAASPGAKAPARPIPRVKPPPPPSSRHGKLIKPTEAGLRSTQTEPRSRSGSGSGSGNGHSDRPLPPPPAGRRSVSGGAASLSEDDSRDRKNKQDKDEDNIFNSSLSDSDDMPEPRPPTPPNASHAAAASDVSDLGLLPSASTVAASTAKTAATPKKPTPAPPPRRQPHARSDSHQHLPPPQLSIQRDRSPGASPRSSLDSARGSIVLHPFGAAAPAPPPPRRGGHASRPSLSLHADVDKPLPGATSSSNSSSYSLQAAALAAVPSAVPSAVPTAVPTAALAPPKHIKPPPPPARNPSVRKDRGSDRPDREKRLSKMSPSSQAPNPASTSTSTSPAHPPPPPPRQWGSSRGSMDGPGAQPATPRQVSGESVQRVVGTAEEEKGEAGPSAITDIDILADLDALQREVDALRGQIR